MRSCSLENFMESLNPWLDSNYIRSANLDLKGRITFFFIDGVSDTYEITDCDISHVKKICKDLASRGIPIREV
ncbi:MAG: hypothetical protein SCH71_11845 [Desulfobulbaceae bacterium]|nr:hypothetical protein [Desulfobulbaceae bacterium]